MADAILERTPDTGSVSPMAIAAAPPISLVEAPSAATLPVGELRLALRNRALADARTMAEGIAGVLADIRELDGVVCDEPGNGRLEQLATLFNDIADFAAYGMRTARSAADALRQDARRAGS